jgi:hypothetical protein
MSRVLSLRKAVLAVILTAVAIVAARAQIVQDPGPTRPGHCTGGPFTLTAREQARFHVAVDDRADASAMRVTLRFYDAEGSVVARRTVELAAGHTTTLEHSGAGLLRAQATFETALNASNRRVTVGSVEVFDVDTIRLVIPVQCIPNENIAR